MKSGSKKLVYPHKLPRLVESEQGWYVVYYVWNVDTERLERKRVSIIGNTDEQRRRDAREVIKEISTRLKNGAYTSKKEVAPTPTAASVLTRQISFEAARTYYLQSRRDISDDTKEQYEDYLNHLKTFLSARRSDQALLRSLNAALVMEFFDGLEVAPKTFNNIHGFLRTFFQFFVDREILDKNPTALIPKAKVVESDDHKPFTIEQARELKNLILDNGDRQLWLFCQFIYFTFIRPGRELRLLKVGDVHETRIRLTSKRSKNSRTRHMIIPPGLEHLLTQHGIRSYPSHYYLFSVAGVPGPEPVGQNYFYKRHRKHLETLGLFGQDYDLYSWKPTGVIALYNATKDIKLLQQQCGHSTIEQTDRYLRKLGLVLDVRQMADFPTI